MKDRRKDLFEMWFYSVQRMDLLIISISGAGVYVILETLKYSFENCLGDLWLIKLSGGLFILSIVVNFISQYTGKKANHYDLLYCDELIKCDGNPNADEKEKIEKYDLESEDYSNKTKTVNGISMILMFIGLVFLMGFFLIIF